jgi:hypothetical protein
MLIHSVASGRTAVFISQRYAAIFSNKSTARRVKSNHFLTEDLPPVTRHKTKAIQISPQTSPRIL